MHHRGGGDGGRRVRAPAEAHGAKADADPQETRRVQKPMPGCLDRPVALHWHHAASLCWQEKKWP